MANTFYTNVFRTQENVNKDNMNYTVADRDQKLSAFFPMPSANNGILPGVICSGIGTIDNQFGFNSTSNQFNLTAGVVRFPDAIANNTQYNIINQTASISQFLELPQPNPQPQLTTPLVSNTYYLIAKLQVSGNGSGYQYTNTSPNPLIPYTIILTTAFTGINQLALCLITIVGSNVTISTDINCAVNYGQKVVQLLQQGRLTGISGSPYGDTSSSGSPNLYFTPTELGNLISLYNTTTNSWITQTFNELSLPVGSLLDLPNAVAGQLSAIGTSTPVETQAQPSGIAIDSTGTNVYVANYSIRSNTISEYSRGSDGILVGFSYIQAGNNPLRLVVSPDGNNLYCTANRPTSEGNQISQYTRKNDGSLTYITTPALTGVSPYGIAISQDGTNVYVVNSGTENQSVSTYSRDSGTGILTGIVSIATGGSSPYEIVITNNGLNVYVTNILSNTITQFSRNGTGSSGALTSARTYSTGTNPNGIAIDSTGSNVYVCNYGDSTISQYRRSGDGDQSTLTAIGTDTPVTTGNYGQLITISPDGTNVYVANANAVGTSTGDNTVSQYSRNVSTGILTALPTRDIGTGQNPQGITISPDGTNVYVVNAGNGVNNSTISQYRRQLPTAPIVSLTSPRTTTNVALATPITITFSEAVSGVNTNTIQFQVQGGQPQTISITQSGNSYTLGTSALTFATQYIVSVLTGITSTSTGLPVGTTQFNFTTIPTGPTVQLTSPNPITNVSLTPTIQLTFSVPVTGVNTTTINFKATSGSLIPITITPNGNVYTINLSQGLTFGTKYSVIVNSGITGTGTGNPPVLPVTFYFTTTAPQLVKYDIYVGYDTANILTLAKDVFSDSTTSNRQQLNGKWVNAHTIVIQGSDNIPVNQGLFVGSIAIYNGVVQSWTGNRSIWNLYNQVSKALVANAGSIDPTLTTNPAYLWTDATPNFRNQFLNNANGTGRFSFILDLLYNKGLVLLYNGSGVSGLATDTGITGIIANIDAGDGTTPPTPDYIPLAFAIYGNDPARVTSTPNNWHTLSYVYNYNSSILQPVSNIAVGFNFIQKIEKTFTTGYFSDTGGGLSCEFWG